MRVWWHLSGYISHRRAGEQYRRCLELAGHEVAASPKDADVAVLHDEPPSWPEILAATPTLARLPRAGYAVWETAELPEAYRPGLALVDEVWTASAFSAGALAQGHPHVRVLPHVVERMEPSAEDLEWARERVGWRPGVRYFFSIVDAVNPRKNVQALLRAFAGLFPRLDPDVRLVLKQYRKELPLERIPGVVSIGEQLSEGRMAALHALSLAYVSAHRSEAWGLGLSEAMSHEKPVAATGWSGNMEFMDADNSYPLDYVLEPVDQAAADMLPYFRPDMRWAAVDEAQLARVLRRLAMRGPEPELCRRAGAICERFSPRRVAGILDRLLRGLG